MQVIADLASSLYIKVNLFQIKIVLVVMITIKFISLTVKIDIFTLYIFSRFPNIRENMYKAKNKLRIIS